MSIRDNKVDRDSTKDTNMKGRRVIGAAASKEPTDYVIKQEILDAVSIINQYIKDTKAQIDSTIIGGIYNLTNINQIPKVITKGVLGNSSISDDGTTVLIPEPLFLTGARPEVKLTATSATGPGRVSQDLDNNLYSSVNISYDGTNWNLDDVSKIGSLLLLSGGILYFFVAGPAANPQTLVQKAKFDASGNCDIKGIYKIGAAAVINPTEAANLVLAGPTTGADALPQFRALVAADLPAGATGITAQNVVTGSRALGTVYHNTGTTPMFCSVTMLCTAGGGANFGQANAYTDSSASPTTVVGNTYNNSATVSVDQQLSFWVLPGNYYKVTVVLTTVVLSVWVEWN